jgi:hypothetical protein
MRLTWVAISAVFLLGACNSQPAEHETHATVIGDAQGSPETILGDSGGYVCAVSPEKQGREHRDELLRASHNAETAPVGIDVARHSVKADLNDDGFITLDEILAMRNSGIAPKEMIVRLKATGYVFLVTPYQQQFLRDRGVDKAVIEELNKETPKEKPQKEEKPREGKHREPAQPLESGQEN